MLYKRVVGFPGVNPTYKVPIFYDRDLSKYGMRSAWIVRNNENYPRLTTVYPIN
ncbi:MAG: hypothetical protein SWX82_19015 [Cyanobacteriota bacterium]|nr:hypothetical protein [Cyanobacteriota bacterium]